MAQTFSLRSRVLWSYILRRLVSFVLTFALMFLLWIIFSGMFEPLQLWLGAVSCVIVAAMSHTLIFPYPRLAYLAFIFRFISYVPWLMLKVIQANIHLLKLIFHPG